MNNRIRANFRQIHRKIAPILFLPLLLSTLSGIGYRLGRTWFGLSNDFGEVMLTIHEGKYLGEPLVPVYVLLVGLGLMGLVITGVTMIQPFRRKKRATPEKLSDRLIHQYLAPLFLLPLFVSALTGVIFRLGKTWFSLSPESTKLALAIHQGHIDLKMVLAR